LAVAKNTILSHVVPYIDRKLTDSEYGAVCMFIKRFSDNIMNEANKVDSIGQHLSGGLDTRAILSVLLHHKIMPTCYTYNRCDDIKVASEICKKFGLKHVILNVKSGHGLYSHSLTYETDIVFSGLMMSEYINFYNAPFEGGDVKTTFYRHIPAIYSLNDKIRLPIIDVDLLKILNDNVPPFFRRHKKIQKLIIEQFYPVLNSIGVVK
jgi:hypothetical protein